MARPSIQRVALYTLAVVVYVAACTVLDVYPRHGPPDFRYTGSDPSFPVWNLGWPLAEFIYDTRFGLQVGPTAWLLIFLQCVAFACGVVAVLGVQWFIRRQHRVVQMDQRGRTNIDVFTDEGGN